MIRSFLFVILAIKYPIQINVRVFRDVMEKLFVILKISIAYIITSILLVVTLVVLKLCGLTTLGTLGIIALIISISLVSL